MNTQSWILLIIILAICSFIVYKRFIQNDEPGGCKDCPGHNPKKGFNKNKV
ncbi:FeoB-associated Cys-rich membrane protein [uncultured Anaerococcus sp.]|mgnify:FL=1|uniref:FeoB-associated Cys-rich membrane protein n=1 Tax=uncultured Anaerococcus sp. TaxID=293428 RepID=UPI0025CF040C|nr:FeoB-associated Cys-rich membrane protein [uncultured Anaerococcus sp.]